MPANDDYAAREATRKKAYRAAYDSPEYHAWVASLTPAQRASAESLGLLAPHFDAFSVGGSSADNLPPSLEPAKEDADFDADVIAAPFRQDGLEAIYSQLDEEHKQLIEAFLQQDGNPQLRWACLRYVFGEGTCESHAKALGMSKQAFHYHVRKIGDQLGVSVLGNQRGAKARDSYRNLNRRRD